jgi:cysteinyl-tRNA synthetase
MAIERLGDAGVGAAPFAPSEGRISRGYHDRFAAAVADDLNSPLALVALEEMLSDKAIGLSEKADVVAAFDSVLGLNLLTLTRADLRIRPKSATITEAEIEAAIAERKDARAAKDFARSDALRDELAAQGVEVMDGDPLGWEWRLQ